MKPFWRHRYRATVVGQESGNVTRLDFMTFRTEAAAQQWVLKMNLKHSVADGREPLTLFGYEEIE